MLPFALTVLSRYRYCCVIGHYNLPKILKLKIFFLSCNAVIPLKYLINVIFFGDYTYWNLSYCKIIPACSCPRSHKCCGEWEGWDSVNRFNYTSWVAIVFPTDRPKSVRNRCVIEVFGGVFVLSRCFLDFQWMYCAFVIGLSQISSLFSWYCIYPTYLNDTP